jgi:hypothetical protein
MTTLRENRANLYTVVREAKRGLSTERERADVRNFAGGGRDRGFGKAPPYSFRYNPEAKSRYRVAQTAKLFRAVTYRWIRYGEHNRSIN